MAQELIHNGQLDRPAAMETLRDFLEKTVKAAGFQLKVTVSEAAPGAGDAEVIADVDGRDKEILLERGGEVLKALEHLAAGAGTPREDSCGLRRLPGAAI
jgi:predicted RNA-binding protein Jag